MQGGTVTVKEIFVVTPVSTLEIAAVIIGGITALLFLAVLVYTIRSVNQAKRANERADVEMDIRPRIGIGLPIPPVMGRVFETRQCQMPITNYGETPADEIDIHVAAGYRPTNVMFELRGRELLKRNAIFPHDTFN